MGTIPRHGHTEAFAVAPPDAVWRIIADVTRVGEWSGECRSASWRHEATEPAPGVRFRGWNTSGIFRWTRSCVFTVTDPPRHLAWRTVGLWGHVDSTDWHITLEPEGGGTRIIQTYDVNHVLPGVDRVYWVLLKAHRDRSQALTQDVDRLAMLAEESVGVRQATPRPTDHAVTLQDHREPRETT